MTEDDTDSATAGRDQRLAPDTAYAYLQQLSTDGSAGGPSDEDQFASYVDSSVYRNPSAMETTLDQLLDSERYPGESFDLTVEPDPATLIPTFLADVGVSHTDILGITAPSIEFWDGWTIACYRHLAESGVVLTTKYPVSTLRVELGEVDPTFIDATPGSDVDPEGDDVVTASRTDLTNLGVTVDQALTQASEQLSTDESRMFSILTLTQLTAYHHRTKLSQFLQEVAGRLRRQAIGALIHVPPEATPQGELSDVIASLDYIIDTRIIEGEAVQARVRGKRGVDRRWRLLGFVDGTGDESSMEADPENVPQSAENAARTHSDGNSE